MLDLIANTTPTVAQQAQTPTIAQQADMHNVEPLWKENQHRDLHLLLITNKRLKKRRTRVGVKKEEDAKLSKQKVKKKKKIKLWQYLQQHNFK